MTDPEPVICSSRGCRADATYVVVWNNPRIHTPDREKTWSACEEHRTTLAEYLDVRGFLIRVDPLDSDHSEARSTVCRIAVLG